MESLTVSTEGGSCSQEQNFSSVINRGESQGESGHCAGHCHGSSVVRWLFASHSGHSSVVDEAKPECAGQLILLLDILTVSCRQPPEE